MYQFTEDCRVGIQEIDYEHEKLFELLNQTMDMTTKAGASQQSARELLAKLEGYALNHFAHEESYMEKIHDPELPRQKREHALFVEKIKSYVGRELSQEDGEKVMQELLSFMAKWLYHHILGSDIMIGKFNQKPQEDVFAFTDAYITGIEMVDREHRKLFEIISQTNELIHAEHLHDKYDAIVHIIGQLKEYTITHFTHEEEYMEMISYEGIAQQRIAHTAFIDRMNEIDLNEVDDNQRDYLEELIEFLLGWLINHIQKMDKRIPVEK